MIISPSILSADFNKLESDILKLKNMGIKWFHLDIMDGHFVPNISFGIPVVKSVRKIQNIFLDTHLMISDPISYVPKFADAGSDLITFHFEAIPSNVNDCISLIKSFNKKVGISIKPNTSPEVLIPYLNDIDLVLVMTVEPGFGGQDFIDECSLKISFLSEFKKKNNLNYIIQADGGINDVTAKICKNFGVDSLVCGSYLFNSKNVEENLRKISL